MGGVFEFPGHFLQRFDAKISLPPGEDSGGFQSEIHMHGIKREVDATLFGLL